MRTKILYDNDRVILLTSEYGDNVGGGARLRVKIDETGIIDGRLPWVKII